MERDGLSKGQRLAVVSPDPALQKAPCVKAKKLTCPVVVVGDVQRAHVAERAIGGTGAVKGSVSKSVERHAATHSHVHTMPKPVLSLRDLNTEEWASS